MAAPPISAASAMAPVVIASPPIEVFLSKLFAESEDVPQIQYIRWTSPSQAEVILATSGTAPLSPFLEEERQRILYGKAEISIPKSFLFSWDAQANCATLAEGQISIISEGDSIGSLCSISLNKDVVTVEGSVSCFTLQEEVSFSQPLDQFVRTWRECWQLNLDIDGFKLTSDSLLTFSHRLFPTDRVQRDPETGNITFQLGQTVKIAGATLSAHFPPSVVPPPILNSLTLVFPPTFTLLSNGGENFFTDPFNPIVLEDKENERNAYTIESLAISDGKLHIQGVSEEEDEILTSEYFSPDAPPPPPRYTYPPLVPFHQCELPLNRVCTLWAKVFQADALPSFASLYKELFYDLETLQVTSSPEEKNNSD